jgi:hypothetical protein
MEPARTGLPANQRQARAEDTGPLHIRSPRRPLFVIAALPDGGGSDEGERLGFDSEGCSHPHHQTTSG